MIIIIITARRLLKKRGGILITATRNNTDNTSINRTEITRKQKWEENKCMDHKNNWYKLCSSPL